MCILLNPFDTTNIPIMLGVSIKKTKGKKKIITNTMKYVLHMGSMISFIALR